MEGGGVGGGRRWRDASGLGAAGFLRGEGGWGRDAPRSPTKPAQACRWGSVEQTYFFEMGAAAKTCSTGVCVQSTLTAQLSVDTAKGLKANFLQTECDVAVFDSIGVQYSMTAKLANNYAYHKAGLVILGAPKLVYRFFSNYKDVFGLKDPRFSSFSTLSQECLNICLEYGRAMLQRALSGQIKVFMQTLTPPPLPHPSPTLAIPPSQNGLHFRVVRPICVSDLFCAQKRRRIFG